MAKILIVEARFYDDLANELQKGAIEAITKAGFEYDVISVPGALEIPGAITLAVESYKYVGFVALGVVIRGETYHFEVVSNESARGLMELTLEGVSIGNGILTTENFPQAWERAKVNGMNKGGAAAEAAIRMVDLKNKLHSKKAS